MLTQMSHEDIQHLQSVGREAQAARSEFILHDDQEKVWHHLTSLAGKEDARIDFVLDNGAWFVANLGGSILTIGVSKLDLKYESSVAVAQYRSTTDFWRSSSPTLYSLTS